MGQRGGGMGKEQEACQEERGSGTGMGDLGWILPPSLSRNIPPFSPWTCANWCESKVAHWQGKACREVRGNTPRVWIGIGIGGRKG